MSKQEPGSPNIRRVDTGHGEKVYFERTQWQQECAAYDDGRYKRPSYKPADEYQPVVESKAGTSRKIIQP